MDDSLDDEIAGYHQNLLLLYPDSRNGVYTSRHPQFQVNFSFCYQPVIREWASNQESTTQVLSNENCLPSTESSIGMSLEQFMNIREAHQIMHESVRVPHRWRGIVTDSAILKARNLIKEMPPQHNMMHLYFIVMVYYNRIINDEDAVMDLTIRQSFEEGGSGMVPASDSSIESLEMRIVSSDHDSYGDCPICMEDLSSGHGSDSGCIWMPCSHVFHGDCIKKWLQRSHYCPMCRFEMPTT